MIPKDFSNKDCRNRSFRKQDLKRANFSGADLRGCDFRGADLTGVDFTGIKTGRTLRQTLNFFILAASAVIILGSPYWLFDGWIAAQIPEILLFLLQVVIYSGVAYILQIEGSVALWIILITYGIVLCIACMAFFALSISIFFLGSLPLLNRMVMFVGGLLLSLVPFFLFREFPWKGRSVIQNAIGTNFSTANLTHARFTNVHLSNVDFTDATTDWTNWVGMTSERCRFSGSLAKENIRNLLTNSQLSQGRYLFEADLHRTCLVGSNLVEANLRMANLNNADLRQADMTNAKLENLEAQGTNFSQAILTGACIANWKIDSQTQFDQVICEFVFTDYDSQKRYPANRNFDEGEFTAFINSFILNK